MTVGHSVTLHGCYVERGLLIGIGSIVLDDVRVGAQSPVAAGFADYSRNNYPTAAAQECGQKNVP